MSETKFTPGTWEVRQWAGADWPENRVSIGPKGTALAISPRFSDRQQMLIDAHLIAAAPELYTVLAKIVADYDELGQYESPDEDYIDLAKVALAKARGEV